VVVDFDGDGNVNVSARAWTLEIPSQSRVNVSTLRSPSRFTTTT
jgi:hypothetical protein